MVFGWIVFIWVMLCIIYFGWKWINERKWNAKFKARMRNYDQPMNMSIEKRINYKGRHRRC